FGDLAVASNRAAHVLASLGVAPGDRVASLMGKGPQLVALVLGAWRLRAVYVPLFTAFAPQAVAMRLLGADAVLVVCDPGQRHDLPRLPGRDPGRFQVHPRRALLPARR